jgi:apolipoprotein N-acyltransferase
MASYLLEIGYTVAVVVLVYYFLSQSINHTWGVRKRITHWVLFGFVVNFFGLSWLYTVYPLPWITGGPIQFVGISLLHFILSIATALGYAVVTFSSYQKIKVRFLPLAFSVSLVVAEMIRALLISLLFLGNETTIAFHFTAGTIGNALSTTPLVEFAYFGGTFGLTFILGYLVYCLSSKKRIHTYKTHVVGIIILLCLVHFLIPVRTIQVGTPIGIVTTDFKNTQTLYNKEVTIRKNIVHQMTLSFGEPNPLIIVYPEDTRYTSSISLRDKADLFLHYNSTLFVDGDTVPYKHGFSNVSLFYYPKENTDFKRGKEILLPFNEYIPYVFGSLFNLFVEKNEMDKYKENHTYTPVSGLKTVTFDGMKIGTLICSEILSYSTIHGLSQEKPSIIFFQSQLSVFHDNPYFEMHLRSFSKVAAAQLRTTFISSTNGAPSFIISPYGVIIRTIPTGFSTSTYLISE